MSTCLLFHVEDIIKSFLMYSSIGIVIVQLKSQSVTDCIRELRYGTVRYGIYSVSCPFNEKHNVVVAARPCAKIKFRRMLLGLQNTTCLADYSNFLCD